MFAINNVTLSYGELKVLDGFSLDNNDTQFTCLFGPSGIGKSTILNLLAGVIKPDSGSIQVDCQHIGYVFQEPRLLPWCTTKENMEIGLYAAQVPRRQREEIVADLIQRLGLKGFADFYPSQLSGGMKQRAALGRAFAIQPQLLLLDEPFSALDEGLKSELRKLLRDLIDWYSCCAVFVTHDPLEAIYLADRVVLLQNKPCTCSSILTIDPEQRNSPAYINKMESIMLGGVTNKS